MDKDIKEIAERVIKDAEIGSYGKTTREYKLAQYILNPWIPVSERLPNRSRRITDFFPCLVVNDGNVQWALFNKKTGGFQDSRYTEITSQVTHWMPIPQSPDKG